MGQLVAVTEKPSSTPGVVRFEINRTLSGQGHERFRSVLDAHGNTPSDELARRLFGTGQVAGVHVYSNIITVEQAVREIKDAIVKSYSKAGEKVLNMNNQAVDVALENIQEVTVPASADSAIEMTIGQWNGTPDTVKNSLGPIIDGLGDSLPVSAMPVDGTFPTGTAMYEKRNIAIETPVWDQDLCIQCGICSFVCPHASIRMKIYDDKELSGAPETFKSCAARGKDMGDRKFTLQVAVEDCTGCGACVHNCPVKSKTNENHKAINMQPQPPLRDTERKNFDFFLNLPDTDPALFNSATLKGSQLLPPMFEFSGACAGCGETPFVKLCSQLFGDRMVVANATGCSSIYGGNLPTTPWTTRKDGLGPAWSNSLFEDNAEFGYGFRLAVDAQDEQARVALRALAPQLGDVDIALDGHARRAQRGLQGERGGHCGCQAQRLTGFLLGLEALGPHEPAAIACTAVLEADRMDEAIAVKGVIAPDRLVHRNFAGAQIDLVTTDNRLLGIAFAAFWQLGTAAGDLFDDDLFDQFFSQNLCAFASGCCG